MVNCWLGRTFIKMVTAEMELFVPATIYICNESHQSLPSIAPVKDSLVRQYLCAIGGSNKYIEPGVAIGKL